MGIICFHISNVIFVQTADMIISQRTFQRIVVIEGMIQQQIEKRCVDRIQKITVLLRQDPRSSGVAVDHGIKGLSCKTLKVFKRFHRRGKNADIVSETAQLTGDPVNRLPGTASFVIECIEGESLILLLDLNGIATSTGSACSTGSLDPSHVLMSIGLPHEIAHGSLRVTLGEQNTMEDVDYIIEKINAVVTRLRDMSPVWEEKMNGQPSLKLFDK